MIFYLEITDRGATSKSRAPVNGGHPNPMTRVQHFFDEASSTFTYVVSDADTGLAAVIDPVLDLDYASGTLTTRSADEVIQ